MSQPDRFEQLRRFGLGFRIELIDEQSGQHFAALYTRAYTGNTGVTRTVRVVAQSGSFRIIQTGANNGRYQQRFFVWLYHEGGPVQTGDYVFTGAWLHNAGAGTFTLTSASGALLTARTLPDRRLQISGSLEAGTPEVTLYYAAAPWW